MNTYIGGNLIVEGDIFTKDKIVTEKPVVNVLELSLEELIETLRFLQMEPKPVGNGTYVIPEDKIETPPANINTCGGKYVKGNVNTGGKDFVGRF